MYFCASIIEMSGVYDKQELVWIASIPPAFSAISSLASLYLIERLGRRPLTLSSCFGVACSLILIAVGFYFADIKSQDIPISYSPFDDRCSLKDNCLDCINHDCGFCFLPNYNNSSNINGK